MTKYKCSFCSSPASFFYRGYYDEYYIYNFVQYWDSHDGGLRDTLEFKFTCKRCLKNIIATNKLLETRCTLMIKDIKDITEQSYITYSRVDMSVEEYLQSEGD